MATKALARGMGTFFKDCAHPESRWSKCPHSYPIRYRNAAGKQTEEDGFSTQDQAIERLTDICNEKRKTPPSKAERIQKYGQMRFKEYTEEFTARWGTRRARPASGGYRSQDLTEEEGIPCAPGLESTRNAGGCPGDPPTARAWCGTVLGLRPSVSPGRPMAGRGSGFDDSRVGAGRGQDG